MQVVNGLLPRPALRMKSGVDDQATGTLEFLRQPTEIRPRVLIQPDLPCDQFAVKAPAFHIRGVVGIAESRKVLEPVSDGKLHVVARQRFVISQRFHCESRKLPEVVEVDIEGTGAAPIRCRAAAKSDAGCLFAMRLHRFDEQVVFRKDGEQLGQPQSDRHDDFVDAIEIVPPALLCLRKVEVRVFPRERKERLKIAAACFSKAAISFL